MATIPNFTSFAWTAADVVSHLGAMPTERLIPSGHPGPATEEDVLHLRDLEGRYCELLDGLLLEKTMGTYEEYLATILVQIIGPYVRQNRLGIVLGAGGFLRPRPGLVRIPDFAFISNARRPIRGLDAEPIASMVPDLAVEVISRSNTTEEMVCKLRDYFAAGVREVWYIYPGTRELHRYLSAGHFDVVREPDEVSCSVLPDFRWKLAELFAEPFPDQANSPA